MSSLSDVLDSLPDVASSADPVQLVVAVFRAADALLPALPQEVVGSLHTVALAGIAYAFDVPFISFKGERIRVFGTFVTTRTAVLAVLATFVVLAAYGWWSQQVYSVFVLTGWQAFGVICVETSWIILARTHRNLDRWTAAMAASGTLLFFVPVLG